MGQQIETLENNKLNYYWFSKQLSRESKRTSKKKPSSLTHRGRPIWCEIAKKVKKAVKRGGQLLGQRR